MKAANITNRQKIFFSFGRLMLLVQCVFTVLFYHSLRSIGIQPYIIFPITLSCVLISIVLIPLIYNRINSFQAISTGRYHAFLAMSTISLSICTSALFSINPSFSLAGKTIMVFIFLLSWILSFYVFLYVYSSISSRLLADSDSRAIIYQNVISVLALVGFCIIMIFLFNSSEAISYSKIGYVTAVVILVSGLAVYFSSFLYISRFIRLAPPKKRGFAEKFRRFYSAFTFRRNTRIIFEYFLMATALSILAVSAIPLAQLFKIDGNLAFFSLFATLAAILIAMLIAKKLKEKTDTILVVGASFLLITVVFPCVRSFVNSDSVSDIISIYMVAVTYGLAIGFLLSVMRSRTKSIAVNTYSTKGAITTLLNFVVIASGAAAIFVISIADLIGSFQMCIAALVAALFMIGELVLHFVRRKNLTAEKKEDDKNL